ncbi:superoxide dismutase [Sphingobacterium sp. SRCM116780]|uniref:superoxide dismutase n=1 Tax=Sphingobacterium sp. SRCM116780 TaxID=2907623 RepID=UPI001F279E60|nr:superoxide dismutase [Sphingobacterium sp. SRCM116780]UIR57942.1 superoxide dismutase [Sphingobacterium sp. SRCM116780]
MQTRRNFLHNTAKATLAVAVSGSVLNNLANAEPVHHLAAPLSFNQIKLPYTYSALEPNIDALTMEIHYTKHHAAYIKAINEAIVAENISETSEEQLLANISKYSAKARNNAGGAWNHNFFWENLSAEKLEPSEKVMQLINNSFGTLDKFKEAFAAAATTRFGSGWAWLILDESGKLKITSTANQDNPLMDVVDNRGIPILALDVWEHAYYLHYQNKRADYIKNWWNIVNWKKVHERIA